MFNYIIAINITQMNRLIKVVVVGISKHLDKSTVREKKIEPYWKI